MVNASEKQVQEKFKLIKKYQQVKLLLATCINN